MKLFNLAMFSIVLLHTVFEVKAEPTEKPNVILIMADDMGFECLGCNGGLSYATPNLDKLAQTGIRFLQCYSQPLCTPSRVKIMTGRYNFQNYTQFRHLDINEETFGHVMQKAGYRTAIAGKWQLNGLDKNPENNIEGCFDKTIPLKFGFDESCLWQVTHLKTDGERYSNSLIELNGKELTGIEDKYGPDIFANFVNDFIERNKDEKFFIYYPMVLVHAPFVITPDSEEWDNIDARYNTDVNHFKEMVEYSDKIIGKIVSKLEEEGLTDNTLIIFTGDNGSPKNITTNTVNGPYKGGKSTTYDSGTHVPLIANWPSKIRKASEYPYLIEFSDFLPTLAEVAEGEIPANIDGQSFVGVLTGRKYSPRESLIVHYDPGTKLDPPAYKGRFVRTVDYKLYHDGRFYNMIEDKWERTPLNNSFLTRKETKIRAELQRIQDQCPPWREN